jgi:hypothetical protein
MAPSLSCLLVFLFCMWQIGALPRVASMVGEGGCAILYFLHAYMVLCTVCEQKKYVLTYCSFAAVAVRRILKKIFFIKKTGTFIRHRMRVKTIEVTVLLHYRKRNKRL